MKKKHHQHGTVVTAEISKDKYITKCLYYGWGGEKQWSGFKSENMGIVLTSLALDYFRNGNKHKVAQDFIDYLKTVEVPEINLNFSKNNLIAYIENKNTQRTETITLTGNSDYYLTIQLQDGVTLVNETTGQTNTKTAKIYGGNKFYLKTDLSKTGKWTSNDITNCQYDYIAMVYKSSNSDKQVLTGDLSTEANKSIKTHLTVNWLNTGKLTVHKIDEETKSNIANTTFALKDEQGKTVATAKTNNDGIAIFDKINLGNYNLVETEANSNYVIDKTERQITITPNDNYIEITNKCKTGNLVIYKVDSEDNTIKIANTKFDVYDANNKFVATITTDNSGIARLDDIRIGKYKIVEKSTNEYYKVNTEEKVLEIKYAKENGDSEITIGNEKKKGYIEINKYDKEAYEKYNKNLPISKVVFGIFNEKNEKIQEITTDSNGYAKSKALPLNQKYIVRELKTREEYILDETEWKVNLTENGIIDGYTYTLRIGNQHKKGNLHIEKITKDDEKIQLGNVEFELYLIKNKETNEKVLIDTYYTDSNGEIYIKDLNTGNYMLKETKTNRWYYLADDTTIEVKWYEKYGDTTVTIENEKKKGIIKVVKTDKDFKEYGLENISFEVYDEDNNYIETITTNNKGIAESSRLRIDKKYYIKETHTKQEYILDEKTYTIDFTKDLSKEQIEDIQNDTIYTLKLANQHKKGNLIIYKVDSKDNSTPLENVQFELYAHNVDNPYKENELIGTYTTDKDGKIQIDNLWTGEYYLKETKTNIWYKLNTDNIELQIKSNETTTLTIENEAKHGYIVIEKQDRDFNDIKIPGVTFNIYDENANFIESIKTDENGIAKSSMLPIDKTYYVTEVVTDASYVLTDQLFRVNFIENMKEEDIENIEEDIKYSLTIENQKKKGNITIEKVDKNNEEIKLQGVIFGIYDVDNNLITTIKTDETGIATSEELEVGTYIIKELDTGSKYYVLNEKSYICEITENGENVLIQIENEEVDIEVTVDKEGTTEVKPSDQVYYTFSNIGNASNTYLENFKWIDYIPANYVRLEEISTGTWNQDLHYNIYYKTNKSEEYILFKENLSTKENYTLDFTQIELQNDEYIIETCFDFGKVDIGFREEIGPKMQCKALDTLKEGETFTNYTKTIGTYFDITSETESKWTTIVHTPEERKEEILPRTGR